MHIGQPEIAALKPIGQLFVIEAEFEKLEDFERHMAEFSKRPEVARVLAGYMELVEGGRREIYRIV